MNDSTKIVRRPSVMDANTGSWVEWAHHLESRLAKYETHHPDPKPGEASIVKHTAFDPDRRPESMAELDKIPELVRDRFAQPAVVDIYRWASHLESVREGLQRQLNHWERMYQKDHDPKRRDPKSAN